MIPNQPSKGKLVPFRSLSENWNYYSLEDGTVLGVKVVVTKVMRMQNPDGSPMFTPTGEPAYFFQSTNVVQVLKPEEYKAITGSDISPY